MNLDFQSPEFLYFLFLLIPLIGLSIYNYYSRKRKWAELSQDEEIKKLLAPNRIGVKRLYRDLTFILALGCILIALARPRKLISGGQETDIEGVELVFCFDVSNSMLCSDIAPNRISFAKQTISQLLEKTQNNKVGLIAFAHTAYVQLPLSIDMLSAKEYLQDLNPDMLSSQGTSIGEAIRLADKSFSSDKEIGKAIILITDSEDFEDKKQTIKAAKESAKLGIPIHVVGIGSKEGGLIPINNNDYLKDEQGKPVTTFFNAQLGQEIAQAGSGSFIYLSNSSDIIKALERQINELPKKKLSKEKQNFYKEYFVYWLLVAFILLILEYFILERRNYLTQKYQLFNDEK